MLEEYVFRFMSVRPGSQRKKIERAPKRVPVYHRERPTALATQLKQLHDAKASAAEVMRVIRAYQNSPGHLKGLQGLPFDTGKGLQWLAEHSAQAVMDLDFEAALK